MNLRRIVARNTWIWSVLGSLVLWVVISVMTRRFSLQMLSVSATLASFLVLLSLGQMTVITSGDGAIDLSSQYTVALAAYISSMLSAEYGLVVGLIVSLAVCVLRRRPDRQHQPVLPGSAHDHHAGGRLHHLLGRPDRLPDDDRDAVRGRRAFRAEAADPRPVAHDLHRGGRRRHHGDTHVPDEVRKAPARGGAEPDRGRAGRASAFRGS